MHTLRPLEALNTLRSLFTLGANGADRAGFALVTLVTLGAFIASSTLRAAERHPFSPVPRRVGQLEVQHKRVHIHKGEVCRLPVILGTLNQSTRGIRLERVPLRTLGPNRTRNTLRTSIAALTLNALRTNFALRTLGADFTSGTLNAGQANDGHAAVQVVASTATIACPAHLVTSGRK